MKTLRMYYVGLNTRSAEFCIDDKFITVLLIQEVYNDDPDYVAEQAFYKADKAEAEAYMNLWINKGEVQELAEDY